MEISHMPTLVLTLTVIYCALLVGMALFQRRLMYHPVSGDAPPARHGLPHFSDLMIESDDGTPLQLWYHEAKSDLPTIVYFHGNAGHLGDRASIFSALAAQGLGVAAISYRGYGRSEGSPNEKGIYADARAAIKWVKARGIPLSNIAFYGESLGTGVAVRMATEFTPRHVFLQAPYTSVVNRAAEIYWFVPVRLLIEDHFDSLAHIGKVRVPLTIFHGKLDPVIPSQHAQTLLAAANEPKQLFLFDGIGHTDFDNVVIAQHVIDALQ